MKISLSTYSQLLKFWSYTLVIAVIMLIPVIAFSQEDQQEEQINSQGRQPEKPGPVVGSGPWENSAGSTIGTSSGNDNTNSSSLGSTNRSASRPGSAQRPSSTLAAGPGGNPDIPFDENMNLVFLVIGAAFAFWVAQKKLSAKTAGNK